MHNTARRALANQTASSLLKATEIQSRCNEACGYALIGAGQLSGQKVVLALANLSLPMTSPPSPSSNTICSPFKTATNTLPDPPKGPSPAPTSVTSSPA